VKHYIGRRAPEDKSLFASFSSEKEESSFVLEKRSKTTFIFWRGFKSRARMSGG
jgi:hypothetical protein